MVSQKPVYMVLFFLFVGLVSSCDKKPDDKQEVNIPPKIRSAVFIANEGNFQFGNASLTVLDYAENKTYDDAFKSANGRTLGDVLQSINVKDGLVYLVINNSQKMEIINRTDYKSVATFTGFTSPRYIEFLNSSKAYVSEFYTNQLKVVNPITRQITGNIDCGGSQEELKIVNGKLYVAINNGNKIYVIDTGKDQVIDSIQVSVNPTSLCIDKKNRLWVGCNGNTAEKAKLYCINTTTDSVVTSFSLDDHLLRRIAIDKAGEQIYVLSTNLYKMRIDDVVFPTTPFVASANNNFYGIGVNPYNDEVYLSDAIDYVQRSMVYRYNSYGQFVGQFKAGIITGGFYFDYE